MCYRPCCALSDDYVYADSDPSAANSAVSDVLFWIYLYPVCLCTCVVCRLLMIQFSALIPAVVSPDDIDDLWTKPAKMSRVITRMRAGSGKEAKPSAAADVQQQHEQHASGSGDLDQPADAPTDQQRYVGSGLHSALDPAAADAPPSKAGSAAASRQNSDEKPEPAGASPSRADALASESPTPRHPDGAHITGGDYRRVRSMPRQSASVPHGIGSSGGSQHGPDVNSRRLRPIKTAPPQRHANGDDDAAQVLQLASGHYGHVVTTCHAALQSLAQSLADGPTCRDRGSNSLLHRGMCAFRLECSVSASFSRCSP